jgi:hypothetical protein
MVKRPNGTRFSCRRGTLHQITSKKATISRAEDTVMIVKQEFEQLYPCASGDLSRAAYNKPYQRPDIRQTPTAVPLGCG